VYFPVILVNYLPFLAKVHSQALSFKDIPSVLELNLKKVPILFSFVLLSCAVISLLFKLFQCNIYSQIQLCYYYVFRNTITNSVFLVKMYIETADGFQFIFFKYEANNRLQKTLCSYHSLDGIMR